MPSFIHITLWISGFAMIAGMVNLIVATLIYTYKVNRWQEFLSFGGIFLLLSIASSVFAMAFLR